MGQTIINLVFFGVQTMNIDLRTLRLHPGKSDNFELEYQGDNELLGDQGGFLDPVKVSLQVHNHGDYFSARGAVETRVALACSRCLETLIWPISTQVVFTVGEAPKEILNETDENFLNYGSGLVDVEPIVGEYLVTELPFTPVCREDCQGLCPICGCNRNQKVCSCQNDNIDPRWEKLKNLK